MLQFQGDIVPAGFDLILGTPSTSYHEHLKFEFESGENYICEQMC